jgi:hypothetical protein
MANCTEPPASAVWMMVRPLLTELWNCPTRMASITALAVVPACVARSWAAWMNVVRLIATLEEGRQRGWRAKIKVAQRRQNPTIRWKNVERDQTVRKQFEHENHRRQDKVYKPDYREELWATSASPNSWSGNNRTKFEAKTSIVLLNHIAVWHYEYDGMTFHRDLSPVEFGQLNGLPVEATAKIHDEVKAAYASDVVEIRKLIPHTKEGFQAGRFSISDSGEIGLAPSIRATRVSRRPKPSQGSTRHQCSPLVENLAKIADLLLLPNYYRETALFHEAIPLGLGSGRVLAMVTRFRALMFETEKNGARQDSGKLEIRNHIKECVRTWINLESLIDAVIIQPGGAGRELLATVMKVEALIDMERNSRVKPMR